MSHLSHYANSPSLQPTFGSPLSQGPFRKRLSARLIILTIAAFSYCYFFCHHYMTKSRGEAERIYPACNISQSKASQKHWIQCARTKPPALRDKLQRTREEHRVPLPLERAAWSIWLERLTTTRREGGTAVKNTELK